MKSHQAIRRAFKETDVADVARQLNLSPSTLYKWAQPKGANTASGIPNPFDRTLALAQTTSDPRLIHWLCRQSGGFFVENPKSNATKYQRLVPATSRVVKQFADLLSLIAHAASDSEITDDEAKAIRSQWDNLKRVTEGFVCRCEEGNFQRLTQDLRNAVE